MEWTDKTSSVYFFQNSSPHTVVLTKWIDFCFIKSEHVIDLYNCKSWLLPPHVMEAARFNRSVCLVLIVRSIVFPRRHKTTEGRWSVNANRPCFDIGVDAFSTPASTLQTPASWPPRPASWPLRPTCVAGRVVSFLVCTPLNTPRHHAVTPVVTSLSSSPMPSSALPVLVFFGLICKKWWLISKRGRLIWYNWPVDFLWVWLNHKNSRLICETRLIWSAKSVNFKWKLFKL